MRRDAPGLQSFSLAAAISNGCLIPLLEAFNPGDKEIFHAVFVGRTNMPARVRVLVDYLAEQMEDAESGAGVMES